MAQLHILHFNPAHYRDIHIYIYYILVCIAFIARKRQPPPATSNDKVSAERRVASYRRARARARNRGYVI